MPQRLKWAAAVVAILAVAAGAYRWPISSARVADDLGDQLSKSVGLELRRPARSYFVLLPLPNIRMVDVELRGRDDVPALTASEAKARLAVLPLLRGRFEFVSATLRQPTVLIDLDHGPFAKSSAIAAMIDRPAGSAPAATLGSLRIRGGLLHIVSASEGVDTLVDDVDGELKWLDTDRPLRLNLHAIWRGRPLVVDAWLGDPASWLAGGGSKGSLDIVSGGASFKFDGAIRPDPASSLKGAFSFEAKSMARLAGVAGVAKAASLPDSPIAIQGQAVASGHTTTLSGLQFEALGQSLEGAIALSGTPQGLSVSGSLAADALNLNEVFAGAPALVDASGDWSREPFSFGPLASLALDLRLSAGKVEWRGHTITDAAFSLMTEKGGAKATLSEATAYKGLLKGEASFTPGPGGAAISADASLTNADIGALVADFGSSAYSGRGGAKFAVKSQGDSPATIAGALDGEASVKLGAGVIDGLSFEEALRRGERRPIDLFADMRTGRTVFDEADARFVIEQGEARVVSGTMKGPGVRLALSGVADLGRRDLAARIVASRTVPDATDPESPRLNITIAGPWSHATIKSDTGA